MLAPDPTLPADVREALERLHQLALLSPGDLVDYEKSCMEACMKIGRALMRRALEACMPQQDFIEEGVLWKAVVRTGLLVMTLFGPITVVRNRFRSKRNGATRCLIEERSGLVAGLWTQPAAKVASIAVAEMPFERAESFFAEHGTMIVSRSSLLRLVGEICELWEENRPVHEQAVREATPIPENAATVAVSLDGVMVMMVGSDKAQIKAQALQRGAADKGPAGFREASVGVTSLYDSAGERITTRRYARMPEADKTATKAWLREELTHIRRLRPDLTTLAIADGAANNWTFLETLAMDYELVDFFHTAEHLHRHVSVANGPSTRETQAKLRAMRHDLLEVPGAAKAVFADMQHLREKAGTDPVSTRKTHGTRQPTFFERHHHRMDYPGARAHDLPIGSGVTESTCKLTVCDRLRRTGMRWTESGGQGVLTLRAHLVSGQFDAGWTELMAANRVRLAA